MLANEANRAQAEMYADYVIASGMIDTRELDRFADIYDDGSPQADRYDITRLHNFIVSSSMHSNSERMQEYVKSGVWSV